MDWNKDGVIYDEVVCESLNSVYGNRRDFLRADNTVSINGVGVKTNNVRLIASWVSVSVESSASFVPFNFSSARLFIIQPSTACH